MWNENEAETNQTVWKSWAKKLNFHVLKNRMLLKKVSSLLLYKTSEETQTQTYIYLFLVIIFL